MFRRLKISLAKPKLTAFFIKDSWIRVVGYALFIPLFLVIPMLLTIFAGSQMSVERYNLLKDAINEDFRVGGAQIVDGILIYTNNQSANFDYFTLYIGDGVRSRQTINLVFELEYLVMYINETELERTSYQEMGLLNHDFSSVENADIMDLSVAVKDFLEGQPILIWTDIFIVYLFGLAAYLFVAFLMSMLMIIFIYNVKLPYKYRIKLSIYLSSIWIFSELTLTLFNATQFGFVSLLAVYMYHVSTYRSMSVKPRRA